MPAFAAIALATAAPADEGGASGDPAWRDRLLAGLATGNHRMICCFHPWMRALVKVHDRHAR